MGKRITDAGRKRKGLGKTGSPDYKAFVRTRDFHNRGTAAIIVDWKSGTQVHLMSQSEKFCYYLLRWDDEVLKIEEQVPLDLIDTLRCAKELGIRHPRVNGFRGEHKILTTNLLVYYRNGEKKAVSVKFSRDSVTAREREKINLERRYWEEKGVDFAEMYRTDLNLTFVRNIIDVCAMYDMKWVCDEIGFIRHLISRKNLVVDMESGPLDYQKLLEDYKQKGEQICITKTT